jgi:hypothetical protein
MMFAGHLPVHLKIDENHSKSSSKSVPNHKIIFISAPQIGFTRNQAYFAGQNVWRFSISREIYGNGPQAAALFLARGAQFGAKTLSSVQPCYLGFLSLRLGFGQPGAGAAGSDHYPR